ncbi:MAG: PstS family phosphate ABC transporter substrate-binding protein [Acidobacteriota bacterium]
MKIGLHFDHVLRSILSVLLLCAFFGCGPSEGSPTSGIATIYVAEDLAPIMELEVDAFQQQYPSATIQLRTSTAGQAVAHLINDSVKLVVVPRYLTPEEQAVVRKNNIQIDSQRIAYDGVAVLANSYTGVKEATAAQLAAFASGAQTSMKSIGGSASENVILAFGGRNSEMREELGARLLPSGVKMTESVAPCTSSTHAVSFVASHPSALGFVGLAWTKQLPQNVKILSIGDPAFKRLPYFDTLEYFAPHPAHLYRNFYPLRRTVYILSRGTHINADKGFLAFVSGREGQSVINKNGLVPATMPVRLVP